MTIVEKKVDYGDHWIHLEMEPEERFCISNTYNGQPLGFNLHITKTLSSAIKSVEAFLRNARRWPGALVRLSRAVPGSDRYEPVHDWICDGREYRRSETFEEKR